MNAECKPAHHPNAAWREIDGEVVIISPEDSVLHELNETASFIWKQATGELTGRQIAERLAEEYDVEPSAALADAAELLDHLERKNLLVPTEGKG